MKVQTLYTLPNKNIVQHSKLLDIFDIIDNNLTKSTTVFVAVSGGSDSLFLLYILHLYYNIKKIPLQQLVVLHYHHQQRKESDQELVSLVTHCLYYDIPCITASFSQHNKRATEKVMREARYRFFVDALHWCLGKDYSKNGVLFLWQHLDDRIETSFLNLARWCSIRGLINMQESSYNHMYDIQICRPLLHMTKDLIYEHCFDLCIQFFEDTSNTNVWISKRNCVRAIFFDNKKTRHIWWQYERKKTYHVFWKILTEIDNLSWVIITQLVIPKIRKNVFSYMRFKHIDQPYDVYMLFQKIWIFVNVSTSKIMDFYIFFTEKKWRKMLSDIYFYSNSDGIYAIQYTNTPSFKNKIPLPSINPYHVSVYISQFNQKNRLKKNSIWNTNYVLWISSKKIWSKTYSRRCMNQKIPIFFRDSLVFVWNQNNKKLLYDKSQLVLMCFL